MSTFIRTILLLTLATASFVQHTGAQTFSRDNTHAVTMW